jgi:hypothetical protein
MLAGLSNGRVTMDFGFGAILDKIEEHFGRRVTRWLLVLVGLAVAAACVGVIWTWLVAPLLAFFHSPEWQRTIVTLALASFGIGGGIALGLFLVSALGQWRRYRAVRAIVAETEARAEALIAQASKNRSRTDETLDRAISLLQDVADTAQSILDRSTEFPEKERVRRLAIVHASRERIEAITRQRGSPPSSEVAD